MTKMTAHRQVPSLMLGTMMAMAMAMAATAMATAMLAAVMAAAMVATVTTRGRTTNLKTPLMGQPTNPSILTLCF
jgi:hypothetical protein